MRIIITDLNGDNLDDAARKRLHVILERLLKSGKLIQDGLLWTVKEHFVTIYPGSRHYSPDTVTREEASNGQRPTGSVNIDVPGITRAYHSLTIRPRFKRALTIPMHSSAYGKSASDFDNTFIKKNKKGNAFIVQKQGRKLIRLFRLVTKAFLKKDLRLMPSDKVLADNVFSRIMAYLRAPTS